MKPVLLAFAASELKTRGGTMPATTPLRCSGLLGATTVKANTGEQILEATRELLTTLVMRNQIDIDDITSIFFTVTEDLDAEHPATGYHPHPADLQSGRLAPFPWLSRPTSLRLLVLSGRRVQF
jgi:hypothetical protein